MSFTVQSGLIAMQERTIPRLEKTYHSFRIAIRSLPSKKTTARRAELLAWGHREDESAPSSVCSRGCGDETRGAKCLGWIWLHRYSSYPGGRVPFLSAGAAFHGGTAGRSAGAQPPSPLSFPPPGGHAGLTHQPWPYKCSHQYIKGHPIDIAAASDARGWRLAGQTGGRLGVRTGNPSGRRARRGECGDPGAGAAGVPGLGDRRSGPDGPASQGSSCSQGGPVTSLQPGCLVTLRQISVAFGSWRAAVESNTSTSDARLPISCTRPG